MNHQGSLSLESCCLSVLSRPCWPCCVPWLLSLRVSVTRVSQEGLGWKSPPQVGSTVRKDKRGWRWLGFE